MQIEKLHDNFFVTTTATAGELAAAALDHRVARYEGAAVDTVDL